MRRLRLRSRVIPILTITVVHAVLGLCVLTGGAGCGGDGGSTAPPEIQEQNVQDEMKAMENAEDTGI